MKEILEPLLTITKKPLAQCAAAAKKKPMIVLSMLPDDGQQHRHHYFASIKFGADTS